MREVKNSLQLMQDLGQQGYIWPLTTSALASPPQLSAELPVSKGEDRQVPSFRVSTPPSRRPNWSPTSAVWAPWQQKLVCEGSRPRALDVLRSLTDIHLYGQGISVQSPGAC